MHSFHFFEERLLKTSYFRTLGSHIENETMYLWPIFKDVLDTFSVNEWVCM